MFPVTFAKRVRLNADVFHVVEHKASGRFITDCARAELPNIEVGPGVVVTVVMKFGNFAALSDYHH